MRIKKILSMLMVFSIWCCASVASYAAEFKLSGVINLASEYQKSPSFEDGDGLHVYFRFRPRLDVIINENLYSSVQLQLGTYEFGKGPAGIGALKHSDIKVRQMFISAKMPGLENLQMTFGIQNMANPSSTFGGGGYVLDDNVAGVKIAYTINDMVSTNFLWNRPYVTVGGKNNKAISAIDYVQLDVPLTFSGVRVVPWVGFANITRKSGSSLADYHNGVQEDFVSYNTSLAQEGLLNRTYAGASTTEYVIPTVGGFAWWAGLSLEIDMVKNLNIGFDGVYGATKYGSQKVASREGFLIGLDISYQLPMFTPAIRYWYASGNRKSSGYTSKGGIMPAISSSYVPIYFAFADSGVVLGADGVVGGYTISSNQGIALELADITFINNLSHLFQLGYIMGTTDRAWVKASSNGVATNTNQQFDPLFLTTDDSMMVLNFISTYNIYENFSTTFCIEYIHMLTANKDWLVKPQDNVLCLSIGFRYAF